MFAANNRRIFLANVTSMTNALNPVVGNLFTPVSTTANAASNQSTITVSSVSSLNNGFPISDSQGAIPANTTILNFSTINNTVTLSANITQAITTAAPDTIYYGLGPALGNYAVGWNVEPNSDTSAVLTLHLRAVTVPGKNLPTQETKIAISNPLATLTYFTSLLKSCLPGFTIVQNSAVAYEHTFDMSWIVSGFTDPSIAQYLTTFNEQGKVTEYLGAAPEGGS